MHIVGIFIALRVVDLRREVSGMCLYCRTSYRPYIITLLPLLSMAVCQSLNAHLVHL